MYFGSKGLDATAADFNKSFQVNTIPAAIATNAVRKYMTAAGADTEMGHPCSIVNMCSISSHSAQINRWTYAASKGALLQMTRTMALDLGRSGIRVNSVSPAWIWSPIVGVAVTVTDLCMSACSVPALTILFGVLYRWCLKAIRRCKGRWKSRKATNFREISHVTTCG